MTKGSIIFGALIGIVLVSSLVVASGEFWACFNEGEFIDYCNPNTDDRTAPNDDYTLCMSKYNETEDCWVQGSWPKCLQLPPECGVGGSGTIDEEPPVLTINSPVQDGVYSSKNILLDLEVNEQSDVHYKKANDPNNNWKQVCNNCVDYSNNRNFDEGLNDITYRAIDNAGNEGFTQIQFRVDSKDPSINKVEPNGGFASGDFHIEFKEGNPVEVKIHYGNNNLGFVEHVIDIENDCTNEEDSFECDSSVDLSFYDGEEIEYFVTLEDIAGNLDQSSTKDVSVDYTAPLLNSLGFEVDGKYVTFEFDVTEINFDAVEYFDNSASSPKWKNLCSKLGEDGTCGKKVSFSDGNHEVDFRVLDEAGNDAQDSRSFFTDSKDPRIRDVEPSGEFASGMFSVEFDEANLKTLVLHCGNEESGYEEHEIDVDTECDVVDGDEYTCLSGADLSAYDGEEIEYWFDVTDLAGQMDSDGENGLKVDVSDPVLNSLIYDMNGKYVTFSLDITEANFDEVMFIDNLDSKPKWKKLCSKLGEGICSKKVSFKDGNHEIDLQIFDEAGNSIGTSVSFFTDSKKPKIMDLEPSGKFASGLFEIEIREMNLDSVKITFGNDDVGFFEYDVNVLNDCVADDDDYYCMSNVDLSSFHGEVIEYFVNIFDIVGQEDEDSENKLEVDSVAPVINSLNHEIDGNKVTFLIDITEDNFDEAQYWDNSVSKPKWKRICSSLDEGICEKKLTFSSGIHNLDIRILDDAGNLVFDNIEFSV
jgi:hypothetical protein